jgi:hypothetical protein
MSVLGEWVVLPMIKWLVLVWGCLFGWIYNLISNPAKRKECYSKVWHARD